MNEVGRHDGDQNKPYCGAGQSRPLGQGEAPDLKKHQRCGCHQAGRYCTVDRPLQPIENDVEGGPARQRMILPRINGEQRHRAAQYDKEDPQGQGEQ